MVISAFMYAGSILLALAVPLAPMAIGQSLERARDLGVPFDGRPGPLNAITDVKGVEVGHTTLIEGNGALQVGQGPIRTGVTVVLPRGKASSDPVYAGWFRPKREWRDDGYDLG
jgi:D-aminopeptidase